MNKPTSSGPSGEDPFDPLGPERDTPRSRGYQSPRDESAPARPSSGIGRMSRIEEEVERLRRSPTPTQSSARHSDKVGDIANYGVAFMGIFSRTRDIIAANFNDMLDKADDPTKMIRMFILEME